MEVKSTSMQLGTLAQLVAGGLGIVTGGIGGLFGEATDDSDGGDDEVDIGELGELGTGDNEVSRGT